MALARALVADPILGGAVKRGWQWPLLVTLALGFTVGVNVVMLFAAKSDPNGTVVEPDYYRKAVEWDRAMARQAASDSLGWSARATGGEVLRVQLDDAAAQPVSDAEVTALLIHNLAASEPLRVTLAALGAGIYEAPKLPRRGLWELRLTARRGRERFETTLRVESP